MPRWLNNVLVMTCTAMTTVLMIVILILLAKQFKMKALESMLAISSLPPLAEAANFTAAVIASALVAPNPTIGTYDTMTISCGCVQVMDKSDPINLPVPVTVALRHKIMTRRIAQQLAEVQYMLKQGSSWQEKLIITGQEKRQSN